MDIIQSKWKNPVSEMKAIKQKQATGFKNIEVIYNIQSIFPTILAYKS